MNDEMPAEIADHEQDSAESDQILLQQVFEFWVNPEIERRAAAGTLPTPFVLHGAQVIMNVGKPNIVRLNDQVRAVILTKLREGLGSVQKGDPVHWEHIESIEEVHLTDQDPDAGHVTIFSAGHRWGVFFDFRYNAGRAQELLDAADEFFAAAEDARSRCHRRAFMENLFAATELTAHARLIMEPDDRLLSSKNHRFIAAKMNMHARMGNVDRAFVDLLNELTRERGNARYVAGRVDLKPSRMEEMAMIVRSNLETLKTGAPKRFPSSRGRPGL